MNVLRASRAVVVATFVALCLLSAPAAAQTEPDFGDPPETLIQGDGEGIGRQVGEPGVVPVVQTSNTDTTQFLILGGAMAILLGLIGVTFVSSRRRRNDIPEPSDAQTQDARTALLATQSIEALAAEAASQAADLVGAEGALVTIDGIEATSGAPVEVVSDLIVRVHRERELSKHKRVSAVPIVDGENVAGLIVVECGNSVALNALGRFTTEAYLGLAKRAPRQASELVETDVDGLTGVGNRRRFDEDLANVGNNIDGESAPVTLAMFDVDHFHYYNEAHGKQAGNEVLRSIAELIAANLRESDVVYRYSGVQFVALLPGATVDNGFQVVERIRIAVEDTDFEGEEVQPSGRVTLSIGIAEAPADETTDLVDAADYALSQAKEMGRNKVVIEADIR